MLKLQVTLAARRDGSNGIPGVFPEDRRTEFKTEQVRVTEMTESVHVTRTQLKHNFMQYTGYDSSCCK